MTRHVSSPIAVAVSHDRHRVELGNPQPIPAERAVPFQDARTGRIVNGREAARRSAEKRRQLREIKAQGEGIATMNPETCPPWLREHVREAQPYALSLRTRFPDPALARLVGTTADAYVLYRAHAALGAKGDPRAMAEARAWLREHRASLRELAALAAVAREAADEADLSRAPWLAAPEEDDEK